MAAIGGGETGGVSPAPRARRPFRTRLIVGWVLLAVGLAIGGYGGVDAHENFANPTAAPYQSGVFTQHLLTGRYLVYSEDALKVKVTPAKLSVTDPAGRPVTVTPFTGHQTQTRSGKDYSASVQFRSNRAGLYHFDLATSGPPRIVIARTLLDTAKALIRPAIEVVVGFIVAIIGLVVLGKAAIQRRWQRAARSTWWQPLSADPPPPPPGAESGSGSASPPGEAATPGSG